MDTGLNLVQENFEKVDRNIGYLGVHALSLQTCSQLLKLAIGEIDMKELSKYIKG
jgi:hypothetical protein